MRDYCPDCLVPHSRRELGLGEYSLTGVHVVCKTSRQEILHLIIVV